MMADDFYWFFYVLLFSYPEIEDGIAFKSCRTMKESIKKPQAMHLSSPFHNLTCTTCNLNRDPMCDLRPLLGSVAKRVHLRSAFGGLQVSISSDQEIYRIIHICFLLFVSIRVCNNNNTNNENNNNHHHHHDIIISKIIMIYEV